MSPITEAFGTAAATSKDTVTTLPIVVLNAHSRCNCRCVMCDIWKRDSTSEVTAADMECHRESFRKLRVRWVVLTGGEPLMHSDLRGLCNFFRELGIRITLLTTGLLIERRSLEIAELFDDVIVSLDGPSEVHDGIRRVPGGFAIIQSGIQRLHRHRPQMQIKARTTVQKANHTRLKDTLESALALGLSGISFLAADLTSQAFNRPLIWPVEKQDSLALTEGEVCALSGEIERLIVRSQQIQSRYVAENPEKLRKIATHFRVHLGLEAPRAPECNAPWVSAVIETDGAVRPCFFHRVVGNIYDSSFEQVLNGDIAVSFRRSLDIATNPTCQKCVCSLQYTNGNLESPAEAGTKEKIASGRT